MTTAQKPDALPVVADRPTNAVLVPADKLRELQEDAARMDWLMQHTVNVLLQLAQLVLGRPRRRRRGNLAEQPSRRNRRGSSSG